MQLQVHTWTRTLLIIQKNVKKQLYFDDFQTFSPTHNFLSPEVTHYNISDPFWFRWTQNTPRIPKMYSFMDIWTILEELLSFKVIATLRDMKTKQTRTDKSVKNIWLWLSNWLTDCLADWLTDSPLLDWMTDGWNRNVFKR